MAPVRVLRHSGSAPSGASRNDDGENDFRDLFFQMLGKEVEAARPGDICAGLVVTRPLIAVKAVLGARIDVDLDVGPLGADGLDIAERNARVLFAEMQLRRHFRLVVGETDTGTAIIT